MRLLRWILLALYMALIVGLAGILILEFDAWFFGIVSGVTIASDIVFLRGAGLRDVCEPVHERRLLIPVIAASFMFAALVVGFLIAMTELFFPSSDGELGIACFWTTLFTSWIFWGALLHAYTKGRSRYVVIRRIAVLAFSCSLAELLATVPAHLVVVRRPGCFVGIGTMLGITAGVMLMLWSFGPAIALLFIHDKYAWRKQGRCVKCGYDLQRIDSERCPECGKERFSKTPNTPTS